MEIINYPIKPQKAKSWHFRSHPYFTKQASNVVAAYIEHYSKKGDTILDPFGGTGVTAIEALRLKRKVIILDINPLACFLVKQTCAKIDTTAFVQAFNHIEKQTKEAIKAFYQMPNEELANIPVSHWYPKNIALPNNADFEKVEDLYTPRQLHSYALLYHEIQQLKDPMMREMMRYVFSGTMSRANMTYNLSMSRQKAGKIKLSDGGSSVFAQYRYWKPKRITELNIWDNFSRRFNYVLRGKEKWTELLNGTDVNKNLQVLHASALALSDVVAHNSIDYIYTDPPYGGNIAYLDLSTMWNAWLFPEIFENKKIESLKKEEIIEGGDLKKSSAEYSELFAKSFEEMGKVLKKDGFLSCVFAHKKLSYWNVIIDSCEDNGMEFKGSTYQPTNNTSIHLRKIQLMYCVVSVLQIFKRLLIRQNEQHQMI